MRVALLRVALLRVALLQVALLQVALLRAALLRAALLQVAEAPLTADSAPTCRGQRSWCDTCRLTRPAHAVGAGARQSARCACPDMCTDNTSVREPWERSASCPASGEHRRAKLTSTAPNPQSAPPAGQRPENPAKDRAAPRQQRHPSSAGPTVPGQQRHTSSATRAAPPEQRRASSATPAAPGQQRHANSTTPTPPGQRTAASVQSRPVRPERPVSTSSSTEACPSVSEAT